MRAPFYLLLPRSSEPPYPVALALYGHTESGEDLAEGESARDVIVDERRDIAPRPLGIVAGEADPIFPIDETRRTFDRLRERYDVAGDGAACRLLVGDGGHRVYEEGAWPFLRDRL